MPSDLTVSGGVVALANGGAIATTGVAAEAIAAAAAAGVAANDVSTVPVGGTLPNYTGAALFVLDTNATGTAGMKAYHPNSTLSVSSLLWHGIDSLASASVSGSSGPDTPFSFVYNIVEPKVTLGGYPLYRRGTSDPLSVLPLSAVIPWSIGINYSLGPGLTATNLTSGIASIEVKDSNGTTLAIGSGTISAGVSAFSLSTITAPCDGIAVYTLKLTTTGPLVSTTYYNCATKSNTGMTIVGDPEMNQPTPGEALIRMGINAYYSF